MMKRTHLKDAFRNIWKQKIAYLSIIVIAFLGVSILLGPSYTDSALRKNGSVMYNAVNYRDIEIVSTTLFTEGDLDAILSTEGVSDAEPLWQTVAKAASKGTRQDIQVITLMERLNQPDLIEGRLPQAAGECAVEQRLAAELNWQVGDTVQALNAAGETARYLRDSRFVITGIANHPDHVSVSIPDTLYMLVTRDAFDMEALDGCFMKAEIVVDKPMDIDRFTEPYETAVGAVSARLEALAERRSATRDGEIRDQIQSQMDEAQAALDSALEELEQARGQLDDGWAALRDGEAQLLEQQAQLADGQSRLDASWEQLQEASEQLAEGKRRLSSVKVELNRGARTLRNGRNQLDAARKELIDGWNQLEDAKEQVRASIRTRLGSAAGYVSWASRQSVDIDDPNANATDFPLAAGVKLSLDNSIEQSVRRVIYSGAIPDEALIALYMYLTGAEP